MLIFNWRNIDALVALSSQQKRVNWQEHQQWFKKRLADSNSRLLVIQLENKGVGLIRIELMQKSVKLIFI